MGNATVHIGRHPLLLRPGPARQPRSKTGEGLDPRRWSAAVAGSGEQRRGEVGPWVGEEGGSPGGLATTTTTCRRCRGGQRGVEATGAVNGVVARTRAWWLSAHGGFGSMAWKVDHSTVLGDSTQSCKVDNEAVRAPARCRPEAVRHTVDSGADWHRGGCRWQPAQGKEARHDTAPKDGLRWNSKEEARSSGGNHGEAASHTQYELHAKHVEETEKR
jgi:hypothetical protein